MQFYMFFISVFKLFYLVLENISTIVRKFRFPSLTLVTLCIICPLSLLPTIVQNEETITN